MPWMVQSSETGSDGGVPGRPVVQLILLASFPGLWTLQAGGEAGEAGEAGLRVIGTADMGSAGTRACGCHIPLATYPCFALLQRPGGRPVGLCSSRTGGCDAKPIPVSEVEGQDAST